MAVDDDYETELDNDPFLRCANALSNPDRVWEGSLVQVQHHTPSDVHQILKDRESEIVTRGITFKELADEVVRHSIEVERERFLAALNGEIDMAWDKHLYMLSENSPYARKPAFGVTQSPDDPEELALILFRDRQRGQFEYVTNPLCSRIEWEEAVYPMPHILTTVWFEACFGFARLMDRRTQGEYDFFARLLAFKHWRHWANLCDLTHPLSAERHQRRVQHYERLKQSRVARQIRRTVFEQKAPQRKNLNTKALHRKATRQVQGAHVAEMMRSEWVRALENICADSYYSKVETPSPIYIQWTFIPQWISDNLDAVLASSYEEFRIEVHSDAWTFPSPAPLEEDEQDVLPQTARTAEEEQSRKARFLARHGLMPAKLPVRRTASLADTIAPQTLEVQSVQAVAVPVVPSSNLTIPEVPMNLTPDAATESSAPGQTAERGVAMLAMYEPKRPLSGKHSAAAPNIPATPITPELQARREAAILAKYAPKNLNTFVATYQRPISAPLSELTPEQQALRKAQILADFAPKDRHKHQEKVAARKLKRESIASEPIVSTC